MPEFDSWEALAAAVNNAIPDILQNDVFPVAEEILRKSIQTNIYDAYTPKNGGWFAGQHFTTAYARRHVLESSTMYEMEDPNTMVVTSNASANTSLVPGYSFSNGYPGAFLEMLEVGDMGIWRKGFPRPAVSKAQKTIDKSSAINKAIQDGIKRVIE